VARACRLGLAASILWTWLGIFEAGRSGWGACRGLLRACWFGGAKEATGQGLKASWTQALMDSGTHGLKASWTQALMDSGTQGLMESCTHGLRDSWTQGRRHSWTHGLMYSWTQGLMDSWTQGLTDSGTQALIDSWTHGLRDSGRPGSERKGCRRRRPLRANDLAELGVGDPLPPGLRDTRVGWEGYLRRCHGTRRVVVFRQGLKKTAVTKK
jgi:hypothetical protein